MFRINSVNLQNFRCYEQKQIAFNDSLNILIGKNGAGKTSIVEAIGYLAIGKSFRNAKDFDVLKEQADYFSLVFDINNDEKKEKIVVYFDKKGKKVSKNEKSYSRLSDFFGEIGLICFSPDDLMMVKGAPLERRRFLDLCLCQIDKDYLNYLTNYNKVLKQRNELLKNYDINESNSLLLDVIDEKLTENGVEIINKRSSFVNRIKESVKNELNKLTCGEDSIEIEYLPKVSAESFKKDILKRRDHDVFMQTTTVGPHRDELQIVINNKTASSTASQGQIRSAVIAMKLAFLSLLNEFNKNIIVVMDDVLSELDNNRQKQVFELFNLKTQVFITCTSLEGISKELLNNSNVITIGKE